MQRRSSDSVGIKLFKLDYNGIMEKLKGYAERILRRGARTVILIGSLAKRNYTAFSDADVVIICDNVPRNPIDRIKDFIDPSLPIDIDPKVYTSKEFMEMARQGKKIIKEIVEHGIILGGDRGIVEKARKLLK